MMPAQIMLMVGGFLFTAGVFMVITRRSAVMALIGIELMLNASNLNFVAFNKVYPQNLRGDMAVLFVIAIAAAEAAVALAIILNLYKRFKTTHLDEVDTLKE